VSDVVQNEFHVDLAFINSGTIAYGYFHVFFRRMLTFRSGKVWEGILTMKAVLSIFPYDDMIVTARVKGSNLRLAFENSVSKLPGLVVRFVLFCYAGFFFFFFPHH
jgi:hypothetical protein